MPVLSLSRAVKRECIVVAALFAVASLSGMVYVSSWGQTADILQTSYGPSVMLACGRGFVNPKAAAVPELAAFLQPDLHRDGPPLIDAFDCALLPEDLETVPFTGIHKRTWHMFYVAGLVWRAFGVAWSALTPLYGLLFGLCAIAAYGLFRLLLKPPVAIGCALLFLMSPVQFHYLPRLRDYAKAPFMLFALFCLVLLLAYPRGWKRALWTGSAAGVAIGLATGFRAEAVMYIVVYVPAVLLFYPGWRWRAWGIRMVAVSSFLFCFVLAAWPVIMKFQTYGERTHPFLMGFAHFYDGRLGVGHDGYQLAQTDLDAEALAMHNAHNRYLDDAAKPIIYETPGYEAVGDDYFFRNLLWKFPGDLATRTAAAALRTLDELRPNRDSYMPRGIEHQFLEPLYRARVGLMDTLFSRTRYVALALLFLLGALCPRLGLFTLFLVFCLAGMASVQFATRHYFHLEFAPLLAGGMLVQLGWWACLLARRRNRARFAAWLRRTLGAPQGSLDAEEEDSKAPSNVAPRAWMGRLAKNGAIFTALALALVLLPLHGLRWHQDRQLEALLGDYESSEREAVWPVIERVDESAGGAPRRVLLALDPVTLPEGLPETGPEGFFQIDMLVLEIAPGEAPLSLRFRYTGDTTERDLSWHTAAGGGGTVHLYVPIYNAVWPDTPDSATWGDVPQAWTRFEGIEIAANDLHRLRGMQRFRYADGYTPLMAVTLGEDWRARDWYQRLSR